MEVYQYEARNVAAFVSQIVRYIASGYFFYVRITIPESKDVTAVDAKLLARYDVSKKRWQRKRRNLNESAAIHYLRCNRCAVLMLTKGNHQAFYQDHASAVRDVRRCSMSVFDYSIKSSFCQTLGRQKVNVRLSAETVRKVKCHFLTVCCWDAYRESERLEREFARLPYQPYGPVFKQLRSVLTQVNRQRRKRGFEALGECLRNKLKLSKVFIEFSDIRRDRDGEQDPQMVAVSP